MKILSTALVVCIWMHIALFLVLLNKTWCSFPRSNKQDLEQVHLRLYRQAKPVQLCLDLSLRIYSASGNVGKEGLGLGGHPANYSSRLSNYAAGFSEYIMASRLVGGWGE